MTLSPGGGSRRAVARPTIERHRPPGHRRCAPTRHRTSRPARDLPRRHRSSSQSAHPRQRHHSSTNTSPPHSPPHSPPWRPARTPPGKCRNSFAQRRFSCTFGKDPGTRPKCAAKCAPYDAGPTFCGVSSGWAGCGVDPGWAGVWRAVGRRAGEDGGSPNTVER